MPREKSAGAIIFHKDKETEFLLLHYPSSSKSKKEYWDFPKGHIEKGEKEIDTVRREVWEETGLGDIEIIDGFKEINEYFFKFGGKTIFKTVVFYLAKARTKEIRISGEHVGFKWLLFEKATGALTFENAKKILIKANEFLDKNAANS